VTIVNVVLGFGAILLMLGTLRWRGHVQGVEAEIRGAPPPTERAGPEEDPGPVPAEPNRI
jgi:hypothetical protein